VYNANAMPKFINILNQCVVKFLRKNVLKKDNFYALLRGKVKWAGTILVQSEVRNGELKLAGMH
jgi:hypothetical protein